MNSGETRRFLDKALEEFRTTADPDNRLRSLWKISQLAEITTDEELYELASVTAVEEDPRLRGELCYTISRSQRPQLIQILRKMIMDKNPYVRRSAVTALSELGGSEATLSAIASILDELDRLGSIVTELKEDLVSIHSSIERATNSAKTLSPGSEIIIDEYMKSWETYLRYERELLREHKGKYVAIYGKEIVGIDSNDESLAEMIYEKYGFVEALICKIEEEGEPIQMPPPRKIVG